MTEKRFSVEVESLKKQKYYRLHDENGRGLNSTEAVLLLNHLVNENEQLKKTLEAVAYEMIDFQRKKLNEELLGVLDDFSSIDDLKKVLDIFN